MARISKLLSNNNIWALRVITFRWNMQSENDDGVGRRCIVSILQLSKPRKPKGVKMKIDRFQYDFSHIKFNVKSKY